MSDSFIFELPLQSHPEKDSTLNTRINAAHQLYHGCLEEGLRRLALAKESQDWKKAKKLPRSKERSEFYKRALKRVDFAEYSLHLFVKRLVKNCWIKDHIDSQVAQVIATRAFKAVHEYSIGKRGKPRFKSFKQFCSVEGKSNVTGIRFKNGNIVWNSLILKPIYDLVDKDGVQAHALCHKTKYVRIVRRHLKGKVRFYAQLIQEGKPLIKKKHPLGHSKTVGLDIGPSTIALVGETCASLDSFCPELEENHKKITKLQRKLERSKRATNPHNYDTKGSFKKNVTWKFSHRYCKTRGKLAEEKRKLASTRKTLHGTHANQILSHGITIKLEKLSYKSFQKNFGKSVNKYAPGLFIQILHRKAENAGGKVIEFSTYDTKLSQTCHNCHVLKKKPLSQRWHACPCGITAQRDLYSAFLAIHVTENHLDRSQAQSAWASADPLLEQALSRLDQTAKGKQRLACFGLNQRQSSSPVEDGSTPSEIRDDVLKTISLKESFEELEKSCH